MVAVDGRNIYVDNGCRVAPHCLPDYDREGREVEGTGCPLAECIYESPEGFLSWQREHQDGLENKRLQAREMREAGVSISAIVAAMKVSRRTVFRLLSRQGF